MEEIERFAPPPADGGDLTPSRPTPTELLISHRQVDDYQTCPLKYRYVHVLRVPILPPSHGRLRQRDSRGGRVLSAPPGRGELHVARRPAGRRTSASGGTEGFLTWEHEEARQAAGREALTRFWHHEEAEGVRPTWIEKEFGVQRSAQPRARAFRPCRRGSAGRGDRRLQDQRGHPPEGRRPAASPRICSSRCMRWRGAR